MNRFRKEEIAAAAAGVIVPATPFSWSVSRHLLFRKCLRAYFLHYYYAQGGWDPYADEMIRYAWNVKKSLSYDEWLEHHLERILRESFDTIRMVPIQARLRMLGIRFLAKLSALEEAWEEEKRSMNFRFPKEQASRDLKSALHDFLQSDSCKTLSSIQTITLFHTAFKPSFSYYGMELWYNPGLIWREGQILLSLRLHTAKPPEDFLQAEADMFALSAKYLTGTTESVSLFRYPENGIWKETQRIGDVKRGEERIRKDVSSMKALIHEDSAAMTDFPKNEKHCLNCKFSGVCAAIMEQFGEI